jgi:hypothetical protein
MIVFTSDATRPGLRQTAICNITFRLWTRAGPAWSGSGEHWLHFSRAPQAEAEVNSYDLFPSGYGHGDLWGRETECVHRVRRRPSRRSPRARVACAT